MSDNDINDANCGSDCGSCGGDDKVHSSGGDCCGGDSGGGGHSHEQADLKMLVFVLVLILAGAVAAHSIFNKDKNAAACGPGGCPSGSEQVEGSPSMGAAGQVPVGICPISGKSSAGEGASIEKCPVTAGDDVEKVFESEKAASPCCPVSGDVKENK